LAFGREIQDHLYASPTLISNITNKIMPLVKEWQNRSLHQIYAVVFMDAIHFNVRRQDGQIVKKAAYMALGVDLDGKRDVLGIWIGEHESAKVLVERPQRTAEQRRSRYP